MLLLGERVGLYIPSYGVGITCVRELLDAALERVCGTVVYCILRSG